MEIIMIIAVIFGPIAAVYVGQKLATKSEKRKEKMFILKTLLMSRTNKLNFNYVQAINSIDVIFVDNKDVRMACKKLIKLYIDQKAGTDEEKKYLMELIEKITEDLGYKDKITWNDMYEESYFPVWIYSQYQNSQAVTDSIISLSKNLSSKVTELKQ